MTSREEDEEEKEEIIDPGPDDGTLDNNDNDEDAIEPLEEAAAVTKQQSNNDDDANHDEEQPRLDPPGDHVDEKPVASVRPEAPPDDQTDKHDSHQQCPPWYRTNKKTLQIAATVLLMVVIVVVVAVVLRVVLNDDDTNDTDSTSNQTTVDEWMALDRGDSLEGSSQDDFLGSFVALSGQGTVLAAGAPQGTSQNNNNGYIRVWEWIVSEEDAASGVTLPSWIPRGSPILASAGLVGFSVALNEDGSILASGEVDTTNDSGLVCVRQWNLLSWQARGPCISNPQRQFGQALAMSADGSILAIGAKDFTFVEVWAFDENDFTWSKVGETLNYGDEHGGGHSGMNGLGTALDINADGTVVAISGMDQVSVWQWDPPTLEETPNNATANISNSTMGQWVRKGNPVGTAAPGISDWQTGGSVSLYADDNTMVVGVSGHDGNGPDSGHVQVWKWTVNGWEAKGEEVRGEDDFDYFGFSVALSADGNTFIAGAPDHDGIAPDSGRAQQNSGNARVFEWSGDEWVLKGDRIMGDGFEGDSSGRAVAMSDQGTIVAVGAPDHATNGNGGAGIVRVYEIEGTGDQR